jgi:hypothetical protein
MIVFTVAADSTEYFATRAQADARARAYSTEVRWNIEVCREVVPTDRANVLRILNQAGGFTSEVVTVAVYNNGERVPRERLRRPLAAARTLIERQRHDHEND